MGFEGKNILVIGSTSGIGQSVIRNIDGASLWTTSRCSAKGASDTKHISLDVTSDDLKALDALPDQLHGFVYCPGSINLKPFQRLTPEDFRKDLELNVLGAVKIIQKTLPRLRAANGSSIVLYSTVAVSTGMSYHASVATAKGAIEGLARSLAAELAPRLIRVNVVAPSLVDTPLAGQLLSTDEKKESSNKRHPIGRYGQPDDIGSLTAYLLSDSSTWITGQIFHVDGGLSSIKNF